MGELTVTRLLRPSAVPENVISRKQMKEIFISQQFIFPGHCTSSLYLDWVQTAQNSLSIWLPSSLVLPVFINDILLCVQCTSDSTWNSNNYFPSINLNFAIVCRIHYFLSRKVQRLIPQSKEITQAASSQLLIALYIIYVSTFLFFVATSGFFSSLLLHDDSQLMLYFWYLPADSDLNYRANVVLFQVIGTHKNALALWKRDAESCLLWEEAELVFNGLLIRWIKTKWSHFSLYNFCNYVHTVILILNKRIKFDFKTCVFFPWHKLIGNYCNALQIAISHK